MSSTKVLPDITEVTEFTGDEISRVATLLRPVLTELGLLDRIGFCLVHGHKLAAQEVLVERIIMGADRGVLVTSPVKLEEIGSTVPAIANAWRFGPNGPEVIQYRGWPTHVPHHVARIRELSEDELAALTTRVTPLLVEADLADRVGLCLMDGYDLTGGEVLSELPVPGERGLLITLPMQREQVGVGYGVMATNFRINSGGADPIRFCASHWLAAMRKLHPRPL